MPFSNERTKLHDSVIAAIYKEFYASASWPRVLALELDLEAILAPTEGLYAICREIGESYVYCDWPHQRDASCRLTQRGVARAPGSEEDIDRLVRFASHAGEVYWSSRGQLGSNVLLTDVFKAESIDSLPMRRFVELMSQSTWANPAGSEAYGVTRHAKALRGVRTTDEYFDRLDQVYRQQRREIELGHTVTSEVSSVPSRVFVSHAAVDRAIASFVGERLQLALPSASIFVASRPGSIPPRDDWLEVIRGQLREADVYLVVCTPESVKRPWVWFESGAAWMTDRRVIPLVVGTMDKGDVPMPLHANQALDLTNAADAVALFVALATELSDSAAFCTEIARLASV